MQVYASEHTECLGEEILEYFGNGLHLGAILSLSFWRLPKTWIIRDHRCSHGGQNLMFVKHRLCENTTTYSLYWISQVCKSIFSQIIMLPVVEASGLGFQPFQALYPSGLIWNHLWGKVRAEACPIRIPPHSPQMDSEPFLATSLLGAGWHSSCPKRSFGSWRDSTWTLILLQTLRNNGPYSKRLLELYLHVCC